ncbi:hypothetical protein [Bradyrhizobium canariense]|uniref:hypothetical protein n=1 Tax=Bradyrhizobium canariense TaxID=255045 RepID=UPI001B8A2DAE|nr:hypothetical protein [Bradyrhizobium canariense]MBR0948877.1 hypothetical protein [Bradyrhizobium canariense]
MMKASGRAAVILLAGLFLAGPFLLFGGVAQAAPASAASSKSDSAGKQADAVKPSKQGRHTSRHRDSTKTAQKSDDKADKKDAAATADEAKADNGDVPASSQMPPEVANANAQLAAADTPTAAAASAMTGRANDNVQAAADNTAAPNAESQVVPPDQLNDIDRAALQQDNAPAQKAVIAAIDAQPRPAPVMASSQQSSAWDQSSLIGKIFIGVGTLLTLASAARMFMA